MQFALPPFFPSCIITKIPIMKILSASQPPSPHFPFPPFSPPAHSLAHSRWRKFIKMKLRLQLTGFIKIYLPLTHCAVCLFAPEDKKDLLNNVVTFISRMLWTHECGFNPKIHLLIYFCTGRRSSCKRTFFRTILMLFDVVPSTDWLDTMSTPVCALLGCQKIMKMFPYNFSHKPPGKQANCLFCFSVLDKKTI